MPTGPESLTSKSLERYTDWAPPLLVFMLIVTLWTMMLERARNDDRLVIQEATVNHGNVAKAVSVPVEQLFRRVRFYAEILDGQTGRLNGSGDLLRMALAADRALLRLLYFDAHGKLLFSSGALPDPWLSTQIMGFLQQGHQGPGLEIGQIPPEGSAMAWSLPVFYRSAVSSAKAGGVVVALVDLGFYLRQLEAYDLGRQGEILLVAQDGRELLRVKNGRLDPVGSIAGTERMRQAFSVDTGNVIEQTSDRHQRLYAFRRVPDAPVAAMVSRTRYDVLRDNEAAKRSYWLAGMAMTLLALVPMVAWAVAARRRRALIRELQDAHESNGQLVKRLEKEKGAAYHLATHDKLTGLANRMLFMEVADRYRAQAVRQRIRFAVMFIDLDRFKPINDTYGHKAGDRLLIEVAQRLSLCFRENDIVSRFGGDEFVALIGGLRTVKDVEIIAEKIVDSLSQPVAGIVETPLAVTPSIGIAIYPEDAEDVESLVRSADVAMYRAKGMGRATYAFSDPALNRSREMAAQIEAALDAAIEHHEFYAVYQPKLSLTDMRIVGIEMLARWHSVEFGEVSPVDFIPVMEKSGHILQFGTTMIDMACAQLAQWVADGLEPPQIAVNVSPLQFRHGRVDEVIRAALVRHGVDARLLSIEITESGLVDADEATLGILYAIDALGVSIAIDDFGTGFSGLSYLRMLPVRVLKIDRSFIQDIHVLRKDAAIVSSMISLAHNLGLKAVGEGIETREQLLHLKAAGCDEVQGFLIGRPCGIGDVEAMLLDPQKNAGLLLQ